MFFGASAVFFSKSFKRTRFSFLFLAATIYLERTILILVTMICGVSPYWHFHFLTSFTANVSNVGYDKKG